MAKAARTLKEKLDVAYAQAKRYNNQELLTGQVETNYDNLRDMVNNFSPFYDLWTTTDEWKASMHSWVHDDFEKIDAALLEEQVENSQKTLGKIQKVFRNKDLHKILNICEVMKDTVTEFAPKVPMIMAMRTEGMKERHW